MFIIVYRHSRHWWALGVCQRCSMAHELLYCMNFTICGSMGVQCAIEQMVCSGQVATMVWRAVSGRAIGVDMCVDVGCDGKQCHKNGIALSRSVCCPCRILSGTLALTRHHASAAAQYLGQYMQTPSSHLVMLHTCCQSSAR